MEVEVEVSPSIASSSPEEEDQFRAWQCLFMSTTATNIHLQAFVCVPDTIVYHNPYTVTLVMK